MVLHVFNTSTWEAEAGRCVWVQGQPGLESEFQDSQSYTKKPCLWKKQKERKEITLLGAGEMAQWLRALTALPEVLSSIPSNHMVAHNHL